MGEMRAKRSAEETARLAREARITGPHGVAVRLSTSFSAAGNAVASAGTWVPDVALACCAADLAEAQAKVDELIKEVRMLTTAARNKAAEAEPLLQFFVYDGLDYRQQAVARSFRQLAYALALGDKFPEAGDVASGAALPRNPERTVALRKLLEARDAALRALVFE